MEQEVLSPLKDSRSYPMDQQSNTTITPDEHATHLGIGGAANVRDYAMFGAGGNDCNAEHLAAALNPAQSIGNSTKPHID